MLHVERTDYVDACFEQLKNVLIAFLISAKRSVSVRQFIDDGYLGAPFKNRVQVHLFHYDSPILDPLARITSSPSISAAVSSRPCVSIKPRTTSTPRFLRAWASSNIW